MWVIIMWEIWKPRNRVVFNNRVVDDEEILSLAQLKALSWTKFRCQGVNYSFSNWYLCLALCLGSIT